MKTMLAVCLFLLSGCPDSHPYCFGTYEECHGLYLRTYGVKIDVKKLQPGSKKTTAEVEVVINRPVISRVSAAKKGSTDHSPTSSSYEEQRPVKEGEEPYDEEITLKLHWSCPTLEKSGEVDVIIAAESEKGEVKISDLPPQPLLTVYPWEFKRGLECILMTEDEKISQEQEAKAQQEDASSADSDEETTDDDKEVRVVYRGKRAFFIKKSAPDVKLSRIAMVAGEPDSYVDIKVELLRNEVAVVAGDRSFDLDIEVKLPWTCEGVGITPSLKSGDTHIVILAGTSSGEARLIMPAQREVKLKCSVDASAYIDSFIIGRNSETLEFNIP